MSQEDTSPEQRRTLWVGGIDSRVDEELLYELMLNAGPIESITIPKDKHTLRSKPFAFVLYEYEESIPYAVDLFCETRLFGTALKLQNRVTGAGIAYHATHNGNGYDGSSHSSNSHNGNAPSDSNSNRNVVNEDTRNHHYTSPDQASHVPLRRQPSSPGFQFNQIRQLDMQMNQDLRQYNGGINSPTHLLNMYMNLMSSPDMLSSPFRGNSPSVPFRAPTISRSSQDSENESNPSYQEQHRRQYRPFNRRDEDHCDRNSPGYDRRQSRSRNDRSRSNDQNRSRDSNYNDRR